MASWADSSAPAPAATGDVRWHILGSGSKVSKKVPATVVACAAVAWRSSVQDFVAERRRVWYGLHITRGSAKYLQGLNNYGIRGRTTQREVLAVALA